MHAYNVLRHVHVSHLVPVIMNKVMVTCCAMVSILEAICDVCGEEECMGKWSCEVLATMSLRVYSSWSGYWPYCGLILEVIISSSYV